ncbi:CRTAC1 family protein, partial [bacterium]|nr:CRTAC1 family protein [bacterium]
QEDGGTFKDVTDGSGLGDPGYGMGVAVGDIDNDGFVDVYVSNYGPDVLYRNNGDGTFSDITRKAGIGNSEGGCSVIFFDFDRDNYLDIYVSNYVKYNPSGACTDRSGRQDYCGPAGFSGVPDKLYQNRGDATFLDVSASSNIASGSSKGLGVVSADFNGDDFLDLYVANDGEPNHLWLNQQNGTFMDQALVLGVALNDLGRAEAGMGIAMGDIDNDDDFDLLVTHLRTESNTLYRYAGEYGFQDDSFVSGLAGTSLPYTGFGTGFFDYDHDGDLDLAIVNGRVSRGPLLVTSESKGYWDDYAEPNFIFENQGASKFQDVSDASGFANTIENSRGLAFGDVDNDGDLDLLVTNGGGPARLFRNQAPNKGNWLIIRAIDPVLKRDAIGAKISVKLRTNHITRTITPGYSYLSSSDPRAHFGLGPAKSVDKVVITWPDGVREEFAEVGINQMITLKKGKAR